jgi:hypothetical protein
MHEGNKYSGYVKAQVLLGSNLGKQTFWGILIKDKIS